MIEQPLTDDAPADYVARRVEGETAIYYFADDAEIIAERLAETANTKKLVIGNAFTTTMKNGYTSTALGTPHTYGSDQEDQINIMGVVLSGADMPFKCRADGETVATFKPHTAAQLQQVFGDGALFKLTQIQKRDTLLEQINAATTIEEVEAITW